MGINPAVKCMMVESWFILYKSTGSILHLYMYYVAGLITQSGATSQTVTQWVPSFYPLSQNKKDRTSMEVRPFFHRLHTFGRQRPLEDAPHETKGTNRIQIYKREVVTYP
jgi:hypothetical protein